MSLKMLLDEAGFNALDESFKKLYEKNGDSYLLVTDDSSYKSKLGEFRDNNINLMQEKKDLAALADKYKDIDPAKYQEMQSKLQEIEDKQLIDAGKLDEVVEQRVERMRTDFDNKYNALNEANEKLKATNASISSALKEHMIESKITAAVNEVGVLRKGAVTDIIHRAKGVWHLDENNNLIPKNGDSIIYGEDGKHPLTPQEYAKGLFNEAPYLFEGSRGGGGAGDGDKGGKGNGDKSTIANDDKVAFGNNLEAIAKGEIVVQ